MQEMARAEFKPGPLRQGLRPGHSNPVPGELPACWFLPQQHLFDLIPHKLPDQPANDLNQVCWISVGAKTDR